MMVNGWRATGRVCVALVVALLGACSDDGLVPEAAADDANSGTTGQTSPATGSVNTSATVTATASGDAGEGTVGESSPDPDTGESEPGGTTTGDDDTGFGSSGDDAVGDESTGSTGIPPESGCVETDDCTCDPEEVLCEALPPECPPGTVPEIDPGTQCWTFACVPVESCQTVIDCTVCTMDQACLIVGEPAGLSFICEPIPPECMGVATCMCMPDVCPMAFECVPAPEESAADLGCVP